MTQEALDLILDQLEAGQYCNCIAKQSKVRLFNEIPHEINCIGKTIVSEIIYEDTHGKN